MTHYLVFNIGCIECGVPSGVVGVFESEHFADRLAAWLNNKKKFSWRLSGQNSYEVFELPTVGIIADEYLHEGFTNDPS